MKLIVGLKNPGKQYRNTRHNLGALALEHLFSGASFSLEKKMQAEVATVSAGDEKYILAQPTTYMNLSGEAVSKLRSYYKLTNEQIIVLHDEVELPPFEVRYKFGGGHKGNNGLRSIIKELGSADFHRVRLGVGRPADERISVADYVLSSLPPIKEEFYIEVAEILKENCGINV